MKYGFTVYTDTLTSNIADWCWIAGSDESGDFFDSQEEAENRAKMYIEDDSIKYEIYIA